MRTDISASLLSEMEQDDYMAVVAVYTEPTQPNWTQVVQAGSPPQNPIGHAAITSAGKLLRARSGSLASPGNGTLYFACIQTVDDLANPLVWESRFASTGISSVAPPAYGYASEPAQIALAADGLGKVQLFYFTSGGDLKVIESADWGTSWGAAVTIAVGVNVLALQVASCKVDECFFTDVATVCTQPAASPLPDVTATVIKRAAKSGTWSSSTWSLSWRWQFQKLVRTSATWGNPVWSGLGAVERPDGRVLLATGAICRDALVSGGSQQGVFTFIYDRAAALWWPGPGLSVADYNDDEWFFDVQVRASLVNGQVWLTWSYEDEPTDLRQTTSFAVVPREAEIVFSRSLEGDFFTEMEHLSDEAAAIGSGPVVLLGSKLYLVGWYHLVTGLATWPVLGEAAPKTEITDQVGGFKTRHTSAGLGGSLGLDVLDPANFSAAPGDRITIQTGAVVAGSPALTTVAQVLLSDYAPDLSVEESIFDGPARGEQVKPLVNAQFRDNIELHPQNTTRIEPLHDAQFTALAGDWHIDYSNPAWLSGASLTNQRMIAVSSFPTVNQGGWHQVALLSHPVALNGSIEASVRMGLSGYWNNTQTLSLYPLPVTVRMVNGYHSYFYKTGYSALVKYADYSAVGLIARAQDGNRFYAFVWEGAWSRLQSDVWPVLSTKDRIDSNGLGFADNALCLYLFDSDGAGVTYRGLLAKNTGHGLSLGSIAHLKLTLDHSTLRCFYRADSTTAWSLAFSYTEAAGFGAGPFGLYGRGMGGPEADRHHPGLPVEYRNRAWLWDIKISEAARSASLEEVIRRVAWAGGVECDTDVAISDASRVLSGSSYLYSSTAVDPWLETEVTLTTGQEAGFLLRAVNTSNGLRLGLTPGSVGTAKLSLSTVAGGVVTVRQTCPISFAVPAGVALPLRVAALGHWYSAWLGGLHLGTFYYEYAGDKGLGVYGTGTFANVRMPELFELPGAFTMRAGESVYQALRRLFGSRRLRRFLTPTGQLRLSYFTTRDDGGDVIDRMFRSTRLLSDDFISHARVTGGLGWAEYKSHTLLLRGRRFVSPVIPSLRSREAMYQEARAIVTESGESLERSVFVGYPNLAWELEDQISQVVTLQGVNGDFIIDSLGLAWQDGELVQVVGARQYFIP